tara:strand:+ start:5485 stop:6390 length:906 start_codon:yes stop_codon:yes gene_type:complete
MSNMDTKSFKVELDGEEKEFVIRTPSLQDQREAQKVYNQAFTDAIKSKAVVRARLDDLLKEQGLWDDEKQVKFDTLQKEISESEARLAKGGFSLKDARNVAIHIKELRAEMRDLISVRTSLDNHSAEGQADNQRFNYLVSACVVYKEDNNKKYFNNMEDYLEKATDPVAILGAQHLANMLYGLDNDYESNLPENKFLKKYKFVDSEFRYINKEGKTTDKDGKLVDSEGRYIDEEGNFIDKYGNRVDGEGEYVAEFEPFLDDDGNPVVVEEETAPSAKSEEKSEDKPKKSTRAKKSPKAAAE